MSLPSAAFALVTALVFTLPWEKSLQWSGIGTISRLVGILAVTTGALSAARERRIRAPNLALLLAGLFVLWSAVTFFWSYDPQASIVKVATLVQLFCMSWLIWHLCRSEPQQRILLFAYVAGSAVAAAATFFRYGVHLQTYYRRYAAPGFDPNDLGLTVALSIPVALYLALHSGAAIAWLMRASVLLSVAAILLTASRTALICAIAGFLIVPLCWGRTRQSGRWSGVALMLLLGAGALALAPKESRQRLSTITTEVTRGTLHKRTTIWKAGVQAWKQRKFTGVGTGAYPDAVKAAIGVPGVPGHEYVAHNAFLSVLVETGLIGFVLYAAMLSVLVIYAALQRPDDRSLWITVLLVWTIGVSTLTWEHRKPTWLILALVSTGWARAFRADEPVRPS